MKYSFIIFESFLFYSSILSSYATRSITSSTDRHIIYDNHLITICFLLFPHLSLPREPVFCL